MPKKKQKFPTKACPKCKAVVHSRRANCPKCSFDFTRKVAKRPVKKSASEVFTVPQIKAARDLINRVGSRAKELVKALG